jgi:hypothetical protein
LKSLKKQKPSIITILLTIFFVILSAVQGNCKIGYSVDVIDSLPYEELSKHSDKFSDFQDLWYFYDNSSKKYSLRAGFFQSEKEALRLLEIIKKISQNSKMVKTSNPKPNQWMPHTKRISLQDIGWTKPFRAEGFQSYASIQFPWAHQMSANKSMLKLFLKISPLLNERSSIKVLVEKIPIFNERIKKLGNEPAIEIPLDQLKGISIGEKLDVEIFGYFSITDDRCVDEPSGNLWMVVDLQSFLQYTTSAPILSINDYFKIYTEFFNVAVGENEPAYVEAALRLAGFLGSLTASDRVPLKFSAFSEREKNIFIGNFDKDAELFGSNLYITPKGIDLLLNNWVSAGPFSSIQIHSYDKDIEKSFSEITFEDLGENNRIMSGIGDLTAIIPFSLHKLGGWPKRLMCTLAYSHTPVRSEERSFLKLKLNGALLEAQEVTGQGGERSISFNIPVRYLNPLNSLEITFSYYLNRGDCKGSLPQMEVTIFKDSFFSTYGFQEKPPLTIGSYPFVFRGNGAIILSDLTPQFYIPIARFVKILGNYQKSPPNIKLVAFEAFNPKEYDYAIMHLSPNQLKNIFHLVDLEPSFKIINPLTQKTLLQLGSEEPLASVQVLYNQEGIPALIYSEKDGASPLYEKNSLNSQNMKGNLAIYQSNLWYSMEVGDKLRIVYPHKNDLGYYWTRYRLIITVFAGTLILIFFFYLYRNRTGDK